MWKQVQKFAMLYIEYDDSEQYTEQILIFAITYVL